MQEILIGGQNGIKVFMDAAMGNRHGMISGATGTGKTITLQILAEGFSKIGVPVFLADIKGDLSGITTAGKPHEKSPSASSRLALVIMSNMANLRCFGIFLLKPDIRYAPQFLIWDRYC
jgi:Bacterial protein of unknown function (DUF853)